MRSPTSRLAVLLRVCLILGALVLPAQAKAPWSVTVKGPGIEGEVDLMRGRPPGDLLSFWYPNDLLGEPLPGPPIGNPGESYILTWYGVRGALTPNDSLTPLVDRLAYYPQINAVKVLEISAAWHLDDGHVPDEKSGNLLGKEAPGSLYSGDVSWVSWWYQVNPSAAASLSEELDRIQQEGIVGAASYTFVAEGSRWPHVRWEAKPLPSPPEDRATVIGVGTDAGLWIV